jgi:hypothetical protein
VVLLEPHREDDSGDRREVDEFGSDALF